jgi:tetratricopeptide (TPR) repeat protein
MRWWRGGGGGGASRSLGWYAQEKQHWDEAVDSYRKALEADPNRAEAHCNLAQCLQNTGHLAEALQHSRRGHELGSKLPGWTYPSAEWVRDAERRAALEEKLPALFEGKVEPNDNLERVEYAMRKRRARFTPPLTCALTTGDAHAKPLFPLRPRTAAQPLHREHVQRECEAH